MPSRGQRVTYRLDVFDARTGGNNSSTRVYRKDAHTDAAAIAASGGSPVSVWYRDPRGWWEVDGQYGPGVQHRIGAAGNGYLCECMFPGGRDEMRCHAAAVGVCVSCLGVAGEYVTVADCAVCVGTGLNLDWSPGP